MVKLKSCKGVLKKHLKQFGAPSDEDYELILEQTPSEIKQEDLFVYSVKLCDNMVDRDNEVFSQDALVQLDSLFTGISGIYDHDWKSGNQHSRIYKTELITIPEEKTELDEPYSYIVAYCYTLNSEKNKDLISSIQAGILKEVSIGFDADTYTETECQGKSVKIIDDVTDAFEWSFVSVPAQPKAGVVKSHNKQEGEPKMKFKDIVATIVSSSIVDEASIKTFTQKITELESSVEQVDSLKAMLKSAESTVKSQNAKLKELEATLQESKKSSALKEIFGELVPKNDIAKGMAEGIIEKELSFEGEEEKSLEDVKSKLKSDYDFLFLEDGEGKTSDEDPELKDADEEQTDLPAKGVAEEEETKSLKGYKQIDFIKSTGTNKKSTESKASKGFTFSN